VSPDYLTPPANLEDRRRAIAAALRDVRREEPTPIAAQPAEAAAVANLRTEVRRLAERLERVEDKVDLIRDGDDVPLAWPVSVDSDNRLEVPPLEVSRGNSPAFDVLLGPSKRDTA
jgi:hypothetical protein